MSRHVDYPERAQPDQARGRDLGGEGRRTRARCLQPAAGEGRVSVVPQGGDRGTDSGGHAAGYPIIYQGELAHGVFTGVVDLLVRVDGPSVLGSYHYEVWDSKLARVAKPAFLLQLCCYADLLEALQERRPAQVWLLLGDGKSTSFCTADYFYYYRVLKFTFLTAMDRFDPAVPPEPDLGGTTTMRMQPTEHPSRRLAGA